MFDDDLRSFSSEHSYRTKQSASRTDKVAPVKGFGKLSCRKKDPRRLFVDQAKENQKPTEEVRFDREESLINGDIRDESSPARNRMRRQDASPLRTRIIQCAGEYAFSFLFNALQL